MQKKIVFLNILFSILLFGNTVAQCNLYELTLSQKVNNASDIFEGKVIGKTCFWNSQHSLIFTSNTIEVYKVFKGNITASQVEIITEGGLVGDEMQSVDPSLVLTIGEIGIFTAMPSAILNPGSTTNSNNVFQCYGSLQGFFKYDLVDQSATTPFQKYNDITNNLYTALENLIGSTYKDITSFDVNQRAAVPKAGGSITGFSPTTITAGTNSVLTITGSGFGTSQGSSTVGFKNADDGGASYINPIASQYVSWSDTQIKVIVPDNAGTGTVRVTAATTMTSASTLTVSYAEMNVTSGSSVYQTDHVNMNTTGGLTWQMYTDFNSNTTAKASFIRAMNTWRCATRINWIIGSTTTVNSIGRDGTNVIRFDVGSELGAGVLGQCTSYWKGCSSSVWYVSELDMAIDDATNWNFGPAAPTGSQYDFESVMLHELGHGHQLGHVIKGTDVMNYALANASSRRTINSNNQAAGDDLMSRSIVANSCGPGAMTKLTGQCAIGGPTADFSATPLSGCAALSVTFTDNSSNTPTTWAWDVDNNGTTDYTTQNPTHVYNTGGTYIVKLKVTNANGTDSITKTNYITVNPLPVAAFSNTINSGTVSFTNTSTNATSYSWDYGDSSTPSTATNASHTYPTGGTYTITLTAKNTCGNNSSSKTVTIGVNGQINKPVPNFSANTTSGCVPLSVTFSDLSTNAPTAWAWDIDNNGTIDYTTQNPTHVYNTAGTYSVKLKVTNGIGSDSITKTNYITVNPLPTAGFSSTANSGTVNFTNTSSNANSYNWDFGDSNNSTSTNPSHTYSSTGTYTVTLTATNTCTSNSITHIVTISNIPVLPVADFSFTPATGCSPVSVSFTDLSTNTPTSWAWDIDNNGTIDYTTQNPTHVYNVPGNYTVKLKVGNANGYDSITKTNSITVKPLPTVTVPSDITYCAGVTATTGAFSSTPSGATYSWTNSNTAIGLSASGNGNLPMFTVSNTSGNSIYGTIIVTPTLNGCTGTASTFNITVEPKPTVSVPSDVTLCSGIATTSTSFTSNPAGATYSWTNSNTNIGLAANGTGDIMSFTALNSTSSQIVATISVTPTLNGCAGTASSYAISVDPTQDASFSYSKTTFCQGDNNPNPSVTTAGGTFSSTFGLSIDATTGLIDLANSNLNTYAVTYTIAGQCPNSSTSNITITNSPDATFNYNGPYCENASSNPLPMFGLGASAGTFSSTTGLTFVDTTTGEIDLSTSLPGTYTVTNSIVASGGCAATSATDTVTINPQPIAAFTHTVSGNTVTLTNTSVNATAYNWDFGDLATSTATNETHTYTSANTYTITLTATNACGTDNNSQEIVIQSTGTGITEFTNSDAFLIYPNPSTGILNIEFSNNVNSGNISVFNYLGEVVNAVNINNSKKLSIDLSNLPNGMYCIFGNINGKVISKNVMLVK